jgi:toxin ParE1/3/4
MRRIYRNVLNESQSSEIADRFVVDLETKMRSLASSGFSGVPRDYITEKLCAFPYRQRCFYFRIDGGEMVLVRVLHGRQDLSPEHFKEF